MQGEYRHLLATCPALSDEGMRECAPRLMPLLIGATVELLRPVVGTAREAETRVALANALVGTWGCDPADAFNFVQTLFQSAINAQAEEVQPRHCG